MAVLSKEDIKSAYSKSSSKKKQQRYFIDGKWRTVAWVKEWQKSIASGAWTPQQILQLQVDLGVSEKHQTGIYDKTTRSKHTQFLKENTKVREGSINVNRYNYAKDQAEKAQAEADKGSWTFTPETGVVKVSADQADKMAAEQAAKNYYEQQKKDRNDIQTSMLDTWQKLAGVTATEANINWATDKVLQGWGYDDFYFWMKDRPEMKKMYPGMPNGMTPSEYIEQRHKLNAVYMENVGRPLSHEEIANVMKGGDFPDDGYFMGQPAIRDEEIR